MMPEGALVVGLARVDLHLRWFFHHHPILEFFHNAGGHTRG